MMQQADIACNSATALSTAQAVAERYMASANRDPHYQTDLCLQGLLCLYDVAKDARYLDFVDATFRHRGKTPRASLNWEILFTDIHWEMWLRTSEASYLEGWLSDVHQLDQSLPRDADGRIVYHRLLDPPRLLIDLLQGYALRMARAGALTGDPDYFDRCAEQYTLYADVLRNRNSGLWHHGRGWNRASPDARSPEGWCRGQAWVLRGLVESLVCIPETTDAHDRLRQLLFDLVDALCRYQAQDGMWHQVVHLTKGSYPETSGTGMMAYYLSRALRHGSVSGLACKQAVCQAQRALLRYVDDENQVHNGSRHTGPLLHAEDYLALPTPVNDRHALAAILMALSIEDQPVP